MGFSLWLTPSPDSDLVSLMRVQMEYLRKTTTGSSDSFDPHATLLSGMAAEDGWTAEKVWETCQEPLEQWRSEQERKKTKTSTLDVPLKDLETRGMYFQCILISLQHAPELMRLNALLRDHLAAISPAVDMKPPYFPHLSLLYSPIDASTAQERIDQELQGNAYRRLSQAEDDLSATVELRGEGKAVSIAQFEEIQLWETDDVVGEWKMHNKTKIFID